MIIKNSSQSSPAGIAKRPISEQLVLSKSSILQEQDEIYCPYIEFAIMHFPKTHDETWQSILILAQCRDKHLINTMTAQLTQAITSLPAETYNQTLNNLQRWNSSDSFVQEIIARARLRGPQRHPSPVVSF